MLNVRQKRKKKVLPQNNFHQKTGNDVCVSDFLFWLVFDQKSLGSKRCGVTQNLKVKAQRLRRGSREAFTSSMVWSL